VCLLPVCVFYVRDKREMLSVSATARKAHSSVSFPHAPVAGFILEGFKIRASVSRIRGSSATVGLSATCVATQHGGRGVFVFSPPGAVAWPRALRGEQYRHRLRAVLRVVAAAAVPAASLPAAVAAEPARATRTPTGVRADQQRHRLSRPLERDGGQPHLPVVDVAAADGPGRAAVQPVWVLAAPGCQLLS
jgi:hypothetical protein